MMKMPKIKDCDVLDCSYNKDNMCHAIAITVGDEEPSCDTFISRNHKGGAMDMTGGVGACKTEDCMFNQSMECVAQNISITLSGGHADCVTYSKR